jgi:putative FmdB family regulatory protein
MPTYEYRCRTCGELFSLVMSMDEHDKSQITCPACKSAKVTQQYTAFYAKTSKKS